MGMMSTKMGQARKSRQNRWIAEKIGRNGGILKFTMIFGRNSLEDRGQNAIVSKL